MLKFQYTSICLIFWYLSPSFLYGAKLPFFINTEVENRNGALGQLSEKQLKVLIPALLRHWNENDWKNLKFTRLNGGLTNQNLKVQNQDGTAVAVRIFGNNTKSLGINRLSESFHSKIAASLGLGPAVILSSPQNELLVTEFLTGSTLSIADSKSPFIISELCVALRKLHQGPKFKGKFSPIETVRKYHSQLPISHFGNIDEKMITAFGLMNKIEDALIDYPESSSIHADTLFENILRQENGKIFLIDWEYSALGDPYFDLGNFARVAEYDSFEVESFLAIYLQRRPSLEEIAHLELMRLLAYLREAFWSFMQSIQPSIPEYHLEHGKTLLHEFLQRSSDPLFDRWLIDVKNG